MGARCVVSAHAYSACEGHGIQGLGRAVDAEGKSAGLPESGGGSTRTVSIWMELSFSGSSALHCLWACSRGCTWRRVG